MANHQEENSSASRNPQRINSLYIISVLKANSDKDHPMGVEQIRKEIANTFFEGDKTQVPGTKTIRCQLQAIIENSVIDYENDENFPLDPIENSSFKLGFQIRRCFKDKKGFTDYDPLWDEEDIPENADKKTQYYYYKSIFDDPEVSLLIDSLEAYNYLSARDISSLAIKLASLNPYSMKHYKDKRYKKHNGPRIDETQSRLLKNLALLSKIIKNKNSNYAKIVNGYYNADHQLVPVGKTPSSSKIPDGKIVRPIRLIFNNGYYYLIAAQYSTTKGECFVVHYRVDRLYQIEQYKLPAKDHAKYAIEEPPMDPAEYRLHHPVMFGDDMQTIRMQVTNSPYMLNVLMDIFGTAANIRILDEKWLRVTVTASVDGTRLVATEYCDDIHILSPKSLAKQIKQNISKALEWYDHIDETEETEDETED